MATLEKSNAGPTQHGNAEANEPRTSEHHISAQSGGDRVDNVHFDNLHTGVRAQQVVVSVEQGGIYAKDVAVEEEGTQLLGRMADSSIHQLSDDRTRVLLQTRPDEGSGETAGFGGVYGAGRFLSQN